MKTQMGTMVKFAPVVEKVTKVKVEAEQPVYFINGWIIPKIAFGKEAESCCISCQWGRHCGGCSCCR